MAGQDLLSTRVILLCAISNPFPVLYPPSLPKNITSYSIVVCMNIEFYTFRSHYLCYVFMPTSETWSSLLYFPFPSFSSMPRILPYLTCCPYHPHACLSPWVSSPLVHFPIPYMVPSAHISPTSGSIYHLPVCASAHPLPQLHLAFIPF